MAIRNVVEISRDELERLENDGYRIAGDAGSRAAGERIISHSSRVVIEPLVLVRPSEDSSDLALLAVADFRDCYCYSRRVKRLYEIAKKLVRVEHSLEMQAKALLEPEEDGYNGVPKSRIAKIAVYTNCLAEDIEFHTGDRRYTYRGIERRLYPLDRQDISEIEKIPDDIEFLPKESLESVASHRKRQNLIRYFVKFLYECGIPHGKTTMEDFQDFGLGWIIEKYYNGSVEEAIQDYKNSKKLPAHRSEGIGSDEQRCMQVNPEWLPGTGLGASA